MGKKVDCSGRQILKDEFGGDLDAYAEHHARPKPAGVENDPDHPWHERLRLAKLTVGQPDDSILARHLEPLYTRAEMCELFKTSDSGFGKWQVPPRGRSGKYTLYAQSDVVAYAGARSFIRGFKKTHNGHQPAENIHQIAARLQAEDQNEIGPAKYWTPPEQPIARRAVLMTHRNQIPHDKEGAYG